MGKGSLIVFFQGIQRFALSSWACKRRAIYACVGGSVKDGIVDIVWLDLCVHVCRVGMLLLLLLP